MKFLFWLLKVLNFWRKRRTIDRPIDQIPITRKDDQERTIADDVLDAAQMNETDSPSLRLVRNIFTDKSTIGELSIDGLFECYILEDPIRKKKIPKITAIPDGTYEIVITHSPKFDRKLPLLKNVPNYRGIRIHPGNYPKNTEGCLLPGRTKGKNFVGLSRQAFQILYLKIDALLKQGKVTIEIVNEREIA